MTSSVPRWDLTNIYPSLESKEFKAAVADYKKQVSALEKFFKTRLKKTSAKTKAADLAPLIGQAIDRINKIQNLSATIVPYIHAHVTTDSRDKLAQRTLSEFEQASLPMSQIFTQFQAWLGKFAPKLDAAIKSNKSAAAHAFMLKEAAEQSKYLMSEAEEALAAELSLSGGNAFEKLQGTVTSQLSVDFELDGKTEKMPMPALINLRSHADAEVRRRAYEAENKSWEEVKETLAACLNGVKGEAITLNKRRGREDALHSALEAARIDRKTLQAMLSAMEDSFPMFRKYFRNKAKRLGSASSRPIWPRSPNALSIIAGSTPNNVTANAAARSAWMCRA